MTGVNTWLKDPTGNFDNNDGAQPQSYLQQDGGQSHMADMDSNASPIPFMNTQGELSQKKLLQI